MEEEERNVRVGGKEEGRVSDGGRRECEGGKRETRKCK